MYAIRSYYVSVGLLNQEPYLDLNYLEDSQADVDMNIVMNAQGEFIEVQGTGEGATFSRKSMNEMLELAELGIRQLMEKQQSIIASTI